jgi:integrase
VTRLVAEPARPLPPSNLTQPSRTKQLPFPPIPTANKELASKTTKNTANKELAPKITKNTAIKELAPKTTKNTANKELAPKTLRNPTADKVPTQKSIQKTQKADLNESAKAGPPTTADQLLGGSVEAGKTSNHELDALIEAMARNVPRETVMVATCTAFHQREVSHIRTALATGRTNLYLLPLFTRAHWLVAAITKTNDYHAVIHDSAPSPPVRRDIGKVLPTLFPGIGITYARSTLQRRGSDDCGIFMLATIATYLIRTSEPGFSPAIDAETTPIRLRRALSSSTGNRPDLTTFRTILGHPRHTDSALQGGQGGAPSEDSMAARKGRNKAATAIWQRACALDKAAADQNLCHLLAASALEALVDNRQWRTSVKNCETRARKAGLRITSTCPDGRPRFEMQALADTIETPIHFWGDMSPATKQDATEGSSRTPTWSLSGPVTTTNAGRFVVVTAPDEHMQTHLPDLMVVYDGSGTQHTAAFLLGSMFAGRWAPPQGGTNPQIGLAGATNGHYALTLLPQRATVAVYELQENTTTTHDTDDNEENDDIIALSEPPHRVYEFSTDKLVNLLKTATVGDRVSMVWQPRKRGPLDPNKNITWTGTVDAPWHPNFQSIAVTWDPNQHALGKNRRRVLPEAVLPDPEIIYIDLALTSANRKNPSPPTARSGDCSPAAKPARDALALRSGNHAHKAKPTTPDPKEKHPARSTEDRQFPTRPTDILDEPATKMHPTTHPKGKGRPNPWERVCPRAWYIFPDRPPHISKLAWEATSAGVRKQHIAWLREIRSMPADLLQMDFSQAVLELVRRRALVKRWKWSTIERQLATAKSALAHITLYTNVATPIELDKDPEWRQAKRAASRFRSETPPEPPPPIDKTQYEAARALLNADPKAQLLLTMLWAFAGRAGDITGLTPQNINLGRKTSNGLTRIALTIRRGKGAFFRGPYPIASTMKPTDIQELQRWMGQTEPTRRIFSDTTTLKTRVRRALQKILPKASLPSIRKGAARHLAGTGMAEADLMQLLGHTRLETTRQYLGYGEHLTANQRRAQTQTGALQSDGLPQTSEDETGSDSDSESL